jgi:hypothetical protein
MNEKLKRLSLVVLLSLVLIAGVLAIPQALSGVLAEGEPPPGTVAGVHTYTFFPATALGGAEVTTYTASPLAGSYGGLSKADVTWVKSWNQADVFVTVELGTASSLTVTPQHSADGESWADAYYRSAISDTGIVETNYRLVLSADGSGYTRVPVVGEYLRFKMEYSGTLTPTVKVTLRNNGGTVEGLLAQP